MNLIKKLLLDKFPFLSKYISFNYGFIPDKEDRRDYLMGASNGINWDNLREDGQWLNFLPKNENQQYKDIKLKSNNKLGYTGTRDSMACTCFSFLNCIEMIAKVKFNEEWNKSDRHLAKKSGVTRNGNSMRKVLNTARDLFGIVNEDDWGWKLNFNWKAYYQNIPNNVIEKGKQFLKEYDIGYEKVSQRGMKEALKTSPLYVGGYAWRKRGGKYVSTGNPNHCFCVVGYKEGKCWYAYDSYSPYVKELSWNFRLPYIYRINMEEKQVKFDQVKINKLEERGFKYIMRADKLNGGKGQLYKLSKNGLIELNEEDKKELMVLTLSNNSGLTGISEKDYYNLLVK